MSAPTAGIRKGTIDGVAVDIKSVGDFSITKKKVEKTPVIAGTPGTKVTRAIPFVEMVIGTRGVDPDELVASHGHTVQLDGESGESYVWADADETGDGKINLEDGTVSLRFESNDARKIPTQG